jgi:hypothetical protein
MTVKSLSLTVAFALTILSASASAAVLWRDPGPIESLDLAGGPGGADKAPKSPFAFVSEEKSGTQPKVVVKDANGAQWIVKFGDEVKAENFAARIVWAAGYYAEPTYYVGEGTIEGARDLGRAGAVIKNGAFRDARFALMNPARAGKATKWSLDESDLKNSRELAGLRLLLIVLSNWDVKPGNLAVINDNGQQIYAVTDWGASMGRAGQITGRSKWDCKKYDADTKNLVQGAENGFILFSYDGKQSDLVTKGIRQQDVAWFMERMGKLSDAQIDAALKASGATADEASCLGHAFRSRLGQLVTVANSPISELEGTVTNTRTRREIKVIRKQEVPVEPQQQ